MGANGSKSIMFSTQSSAQDVNGKKKLFTAASAAAVGMVTVKAAPMGAKVCAYSSPDEASIDAGYKMYKHGCAACHQPGN